MARYAGPGTKGNLGPRRPPAAKGRAPKYDSRGVRRMAGGGTVKAGKPKTGK